MEKLFEFRSWNSQTRSTVTQAEMAAVRMGHWARIAHVGDKSKPHPEFDRGEGYYVCVRE